METKIRILTADANDDYRFLLGKAIDADGRFEAVGSASDGIEALALITETKPDIVLTDIVLAKLDGIGVLRRLPETGANPKVIVVSGFFKKDTTDTAADKMMKVLEAEAAAGHKAQLSP